MLGTVVPESLILYLFFFYFFWAIGDQVLKMEAVVHHASLITKRTPFFWPHPRTTVIHRARPVAKMGVPL